MAPRRPLVIGGTVQEGQLHLDDRRFLDAALKAWAGRVTVTIASEKTTRSQRANAWLWGVVYKLMAEESGHSTDDIHEQMKLRHNSKLVTDLGTGEEIRIAQSTAKLDVTDFGVYIERVMLDGSEWLGITWPEPRASEDWRERVA